MKGVFFPPGDTRFGEDADREASLWRELSFALHLVRQAVNPPLEMKECLNGWRGIAEKLAEPPRKRKGQMVMMGDYENQK